MITTFKANNSQFKNEETNDKVILFPQTMTNRNNLLHFLFRKASGAVFAAAFLLRGLQGW